MVELVEHTCGECGCVWGFPVVLKNQRLADGKSFYCPNGHARSFTRGQTEADKLRRERDQLKQRLAERDDAVSSARKEAEAARRQTAAQKGQVTRLRNRAKAGVCPCCNRTFKQLAAHMASQHPEFTPEAPEVVEA